jgi:transcriptional regulator with XRE-family HTH domain
MPGERGGAVRREPGHLSPAGGISQEELGFRASLHRTEISQLERGVRLPKIDTLVKLAGALSVPPGDLLKGIAWTQGRTRVGRFRVSDRDASL